MDFVRSLCHPLVLFRMGISIDCHRKYQDKEKKSNHVFTSLLNSVERLKQSSRLIAVVNGWL